MLGASFYGIASGTASNDQSGSLDETITYDANGNIQTLVRKQNLRTASGQTYSNSSQTIDNLTYTYQTAHGNRLAKVEDAITGTTGDLGFANGVNSTSEYAYDTLGNMKIDRNKGIASITYNELGKAKVVTFGDGRSITYLYDGGGAKLRVKNHPVTGANDSTDYVGGFVYKNASLNFFASPEGRVVKNGWKYEYQYAISDHQGNTRVLFAATAPPPLTVRADMETSPNNNFLNSTTNRVNADLYDHTDVGMDSTDYSQKLTGASGQQVGVARTIHVYPGDKVKIEAYAKYFGSSGTSNLSGFATALLNAFSLSSPAGGELGTPSAGVNVWGSVVAAGGGKTNNSYPKAFVNLLIFDKNFNYLDLGYDGINGGEQTSDPAKAPHDYMIQEYRIKEEGYVFAYVSNENPTLVEVYFDDVVITHTKSNLLQSNEYYPFGMTTASSWTRENVPGNNFLGNGGTELNTTSQLYDLEYRNFDPVLGRLHQVDPLADGQSSFTPYHFAYNNPVSFVDVNGAKAKPWSTDFAESYIGDDYGERNSWAKLVAHGGMDGAVGGAGEGWSGIIDIYGDAYYSPMSGEEAIAAMNAKIEAEKAEQKKQDTTPYTGDINFFKYGQMSTISFVNGLATTLETYAFSNLRQETNKYDLTSGEVTTDSNIENTPIGEGCQRSGNPIVDRIHRGQLRFAANPFGALILELPSFAGGEALSILGRAYKALKAAKGGMTELQLVTRQHRKQKQQLEVQEV